MKRIVVSGAVVWIVAISLVHWWVNGNLQALLSGKATDAQKFRVGFLPVT